jgi:hypothetical protein
VVATAPPRVCNQMQTTEVSERLVVAAPVARDRRAGQVNGLR